MIEITNHFEERFKERVANTKRVQLYANRAFHFGKPVNLIKNKAIARALHKKEAENGRTARIYLNSVYWFDGKKAITIYPIPQKMHKAI